MWVLHTQRRDPEPVDKYRIETLRVCQDTLHVSFTLADVRPRGAGKWRVVDNRNGVFTQCVALWGKIELISTYTRVESRQNVTRH